MKKCFKVVFLSFLSFGIFSCTTVDPLIKENNDFLSQSSGEAFRVVMTSDSYLVQQKAYSSNMSRQEDTSGDSYFMERMKKLDVVNEKREGLIRVWVYPDSGRLMKVRFLESTYIQEIDKLIIDDIQRWTFQYNRGISPLVFTVRYRVVLRKTMSDAEILDEYEKHK
ncbi:MAG: hypothetical protein JXK07_06440 [Spirochaetes bacterium]|nr:hypothetical protein [Spirochaetota bacterium]MBN2769577.1 hypothetical protein [Spirochaetota bacterium]